LAAEEEPCSGGPARFVKRFTFVVTGEDSVNFQVMGFISGNDVGS
jgi:hypothetical protein